MGFILWNQLKSLQKQLKKNLNLDFFLIVPYMSLSNGLELGLSFSSSKITQSKNRIFYCLGTSQSLNLKKYKYDENSDFLIYQGHHGNSTVLLANIVLPTPTFIEKSSSFFTLQGFLEKINRVLMPFGDSRVDSEIFRYFGLKYDFLTLKTLDVKTLGNFGYLSFFNDKKNVVNFLNYFELKNNLKKKQVSIVKNKISQPFFSNFYMTDSISESSLTLSLTANDFVFNKSNFRK